MHVQMEGASGIANSTECDPGDPSWETRGRDLVTAEAYAAVTAAQRFAESIVVVDAHRPGGHCLRAEALGLRSADMLIQRGHVMASHEAPRFPGMDGFSGADALILLGAHGMTGEPGILSHTAAPGGRLFLADREIGEVTLDMLAAAEIGIPTVFVSGDDAAVVEARRAIGVLPPNVCTTKSPRRDGGGYALRGVRITLSRIARQVAIACAEQCRLTPGRRRNRSEMLTKAARAVGGTLEFATASDARRVRLGGHNFRDGRLSFLAATAAAGSPAADRAAA